MRAQAVQLLLEAPHSVPAPPSPPLSRAQACGLACWLRVARVQAEAGRAIGGARLSVCLCFSRLPLCLSLALEYLPPSVAVWGPGRRRGARRCQKPL